MAKMRIKKRKQSLGTHIDSLAAIPGRITRWWRRMRGSWVYREVFWAAFFGEGLEYEVLFSSLAGVVFILMGVIGLGYTIFDTRFKGLVWLAFIAIFVALVVIGFRQLSDLNGPLWWADRFALRAHGEYNTAGSFHPYDRYSQRFRSQTRRTPMPLRLEEVTYLCELYHQYCTGTVSQQALQQLGTYTPQEIAFFYQFFDIQPSDPRFPPQYIGSATPPPAP